MIISVQSLRCMIMRVVYMCRCRTAGPGPEDAAWHRSSSGGTDDHLRPDPSRRPSQRAPGAASQTQVSANTQHEDREQKGFAIAETNANSRKRRNVRNDRGFSRRDASHDVVTTRVQTKPSSIRVHRARVQLKGLGYRQTSPQNSSVRFG